MKLLICFCTFTIISAVVPQINKIHRNAPLSIKRSSGYPTFKPGLKNNIVPLHLHFNQKYLNPVYIPKKMHHVKLGQFSDNGKRSMRVEPQVKNVDWIPTLSIPITKNSFPELAQKTSQNNFPGKSKRRFKEPQRNGLPKSIITLFPNDTPLTVPYIKRIQPQQPNHNLAPNQVKEHFSQIVSNSAIKPKVVYNPFVTNVQQSNIDNFFVHQVGSISDPFFVASIQKPISPIFTPLKIENHPENTRKIFLENFNIDQFLEQQKAHTLASKQPVFNSPNDPANYFNDFKTVKANYVPENHRSNYLPLTQNYRDDKIHEPWSETEIEKNVDEPEIKLEDVPTKPIYPGERQWAKPHLKHKPYIRNNEGDNEIEEPSEPSDGYDTFVKGQEQFNTKRDEFQNQLNQLPVTNNLGHFLPSNSENTNQEQNESSEEVDDEEFVPTKLYAQVRHSEEEDHLPSEEGEGGRLKELIKDSKVQTVYTEEGYEDIGYDHAGHEKLAEQDEGFEEADKKLQTADEKKTPRKKHIKESSSYTKGDKILSDEDIEADKVALGINEDSDSAGSHYAEVSSVSLLDTENKNLKKDKRDKNKNTKKDFISTKETKTLMTKDSDRGNLELAITGEIQVTMQPNNSSKLNQFVKKLPTVHKIMNTNKKTVVEDGIALVEEIVPKPKALNLKLNESNNYMDKNVKSLNKTNFTRYFLPEIESLDLSTTAPASFSPETAEMSVTSQNDLVKVDNEVSKISNKVRQKRFTNDFPEINVDTHFLSKIKHVLGPTKEDLTFNKYPYYKHFKNLGLNENSPLRYAESMDNIPRKEEGNMAFYEQAESRNSCPEIVSTVDPIPERIQDAENEANEEEEEENTEENESQSEKNYNEEEEEESQIHNVPEQPKTPRLSGLGNKIDCLKVMYFGENPLDSPFFQEETVGPVVSIFNDFKTNLFTNEKTSETILSQNILTTSKEKEMVPSPPVLNNEPIVKTTKPLIQRISKNNTTQEDEVVASIEIKDNNYSKRIKQNKRGQKENVINATKIVENSDSKPTEIKMNIKPKNIYDQIRLLNYLPDVNTDRIEVLKTAHSAFPKAEKLVTRSSLLNSVRTPKKFEEESANIGPDAEALAMKRRRRFRIRPKYPLYPAFKVNSYVPTTTYPPYDHDHSFAPTMPTKSKLISEVFYKNDIKPSEQMNVFTDILNNIKTSSEDKTDNSYVNDKSINAENYVYEVKPNLKIPKSQQNIIPYDTYLQAYQNMEVDTEFYSSVTTSPKPPKQLQKTNYYEVTEEPFATVYPTKIINVGNKKRLVVFVSSTPKSVSFSTTQQPSTNIDGLLKEQKRNMSIVQGLFPPKPQNFLHTFKRDNTIFEFNQADDTANKIVNKFLFMGMKPPPMQKVYMYSDFLNKHPYRNRKFGKRRSKRSTSRTAYASLHRRRGSEETAKEPTTSIETDDDYVPHRSKNYYYDEKLGKIVYLNQNYNKEEDEDEEIEDIPAEIGYQEVKKERKTTSTTPKQNPIFATATPPPEGQSYIDVIKKLKSNTNYHAIPDPVSTEASEIVTTTIKPVSTTPPEFLSILARVHSDSNYKSIKNPDDKKTKTKLTTVNPVEQVEEEEEEEQQESHQKDNLKNSRGGDMSLIGDKFKIFDITDFIPKIKNYLPKTSIDTSRYQTIQRMSYKTTPSDEQEPNPITENLKVDQELSQKPLTSETSNQRKIEIIVEDTVTKETSTPANTTPVVSSASSQISNSRRRAQVTRGRARRPARTTFTTSTPPATTEPIQRNTRTKITRVRTRTTTDRYLDEVDDGSTKVLRRRSNSKDKVFNDGSRDIEEKTDNRKSKEIESLNSAYKLLNINKTEKANDVKLFKKHDPNIKHGGNYRRIVNEEDLLNHSLDILDDSETNQSSNLNKGQVAKAVKVFKKYDPNQKHGGNYRTLNDGTVINNSEQTPINNMSEGSNKKKNVEIIAEYDQSKKHGGNYKREDDEYDKNNENKIAEASNNSNEEALSNEQIQLFSQENKLDKREENKVLRLSLLDDYYSSMKKFTTQKPQITPSKPKRFNGVIPKKNFQNINSQVSTLTDIIPKPEMFFTDPNLPLAVNMLIESVSLSTDDVHKFSNNRENSDINNINGNRKLIKENEGKNENFNYNIKNPRFTPESTPSPKYYSDTVDVSSDRYINAPPTIVSSTKKPLFIKDPSKRLYFYAPI